MPLFLNESVVRQVLTWPLAMDALAAAHCALSQGEATDEGRQRTRLPQTVLHVLQGGLPVEDVLGFKAYTSHRSGVRFLVFLFGASDGALRAVLEGDFLGRMRTAAASALATGALARTDATVLGVLGAGGQAAAHIEALARVRDLRQIKVFSRNAERRAAFCEKLRERLDVPVLAVDAPEAAVRGSDIVSTLTTSATPVFEAGWLEAGTHINAVGANALTRRELEEACVRRCHLIVVDSRATALKEAGDLFPLLEKGRLRERQLVELGDVLSGCHPARGTATEITLFESQGLAIQDLALAVRVEALARAQGLGVEWPFGSSIDAGAAER